MFVVFFIKKETVFREIYSLRAYFQFEVLIYETIAIYRRSSRAVVVRKVAALNHLRQTFG